MRARGVVLDFHETLAHLRPSTTQRLAAELGVAPEACRHAIRDLDARTDELRRQDGWPPQQDLWPQVYALLMDILGIEGDATALARTMTARYHTPSAYAVFPEVPRVLAQLADAGVRIGIVSNTDVDLDAILSHLELDRFVAMALALGAYGLEKPQPEAFQLALDGLCVPAPQVWFVGDSLHEAVAAAQAAGLGAALVDRNGHHEPAEVPPGVVHLDSLDKLLQLLNVPTEPRV